MTTDWLALLGQPALDLRQCTPQGRALRADRKGHCRARAGAAARVLDYGCGEALHADLVAEAAGELFLCEAAPGVREGLVDRFAGQRNIHVLAPHEAARLAEHSLDLIVLHSVVQYSHRGRRQRFVCIVSPAAEARRHARCRDIIPPNVPAVTDALAGCASAPTTDFSSPRPGASSARYCRIIGSFAQSSG